MKRNEAAIVRSRACIILSMERTYDRFVDLVAIRVYRRILSVLGIALPI